MVWLLFNFYPQGIYALCDLGCNLDAVNKEGETALHIMIKRGRLGCVMALLSRGADADAVTSHGNNALHLAIEVTELSQVPVLFDSIIACFFQDPFFNLLHVASGIAGLNVVSVFHIVCQSGVSTVAV